MFVLPIPLIRKNRIIKLLIKEKAFSKDSAKSLNEIGLVNPCAFPSITIKLIEKGIICKTEDEKYYIKKNS